jgi:hypothetical protein
MGRVMVYHDQGLSRLDNWLPEFAELLKRVRVHCNDKVHLFHFGALSYRKGNGLQDLFRKFAHPSGRSESNLDFVVNAPNENGERVSGANGVGVRVLMADY